VIPTATQLRINRDKLEIPKTVPINCDNNFKLTQAVQPYPVGSVNFQEAYRLERFRDPVSRMRIPMLAASVSAERVFEVFIDLLRPLGDTVNVVLETSHDHGDDCHEDLRRGEIDLPVLCSYLCEHEEMLVHDGCTGIAVIAGEQPIEVQLDEHKLIYVFAYNLKPFRRVLRFHGIRRHEQLRLIAESEHLHHSTTGYEEEFHQLCRMIGAENLEPITSDDNGWLGC
jgi:hypothetical protein